MFEGGRRDALAADKVSALALEIGIDPETLAAFTEISARGASVPKFCPTPDCPRNVPYVAGGCLCIHASVAPGPAGKRSYCALCGELLDDRCPNVECGAPVCPGAFCPSCGTPYVTPNLPPGADPESYAAERRRLLSELRGLLPGDRSSVGAGTASPPEPNSNKR
jgi:hypothetical protein